MVKPGGTGRPRLAISARLAPLPPSRLRMSLPPSALPPPKAYAHFAAEAATPLPSRASGVEAERGDAGRRKGETLVTARFATLRGAAAADLRGAAKPWRAAAFFAPAAAFGRPFFSARDALARGRRVRGGLVGFTMTMSRNFVFRPRQSTLGMPPQPCLWAKD